MLKFGVPNANPCTKFDLKSSLKSIWEHLNDR